MAASSTSSTSAKVVPLVSSEFVISQIVEVIASNRLDLTGRPHLLTWEIIESGKENSPNIFVIKKLDPMSFRVQYAAGYPIDPEAFPKITEFIKTSHLDPEDEKESEY